jgi:hypothetical protein
MWNYMLMQVRNIGKGEIAFELQKKYYEKE